MALIQQQPMKEMVDELIEDAEDEEIGIGYGFFKVIRKMALGNIIRGFMTGIGVFLGSLFCHYYILPHLDLQFYSLYLIKLHKIKA